MLALPQRPLTTRISATSPAAGDRFFWVSQRELSGVPRSPADQRHVHLSIGLSIHPLYIYIYVCIYIYIYTHNNIHIYIYMYVIIYVYTWDTKYCTYVCIYWHSQWVDLRQAAAAADSLTETIGELFNVGCLSCQHHFGGFPSMRGYPHSWVVYNGKPMNNPLINGAFPYGGTQKWMLCNGKSY